MAVWSMAEEARVYGEGGRREVALPDTGLKALAKDRLASLGNMAWFWILRRLATTPARGCIYDEIDSDCPVAAEAERSNCGRQHSQTNETLRTTAPKCDRTRTMHTLAMESSWQHEYRRNDLLWQDCSTVLKATLALVNQVSVM